MATLVLPEAARNESVRSLSKNGLHHLLHESLAALSHWYEGEEEEEGEKEEIELVQLSSGAHCRLHASAESCLSSLRAGTASIAAPGPSPDFLTLPVGVHLHIFSFLDAVSLCRLSRTCRYMHDVTSDPLLWTCLLERDVGSWNVIGHLSHPQVYREASSDLCPKLIYRQCWSHRDWRPRQSFAYPITRPLLSLVRKIQGHIPRVLMFGSGLESVPLVRSMLWESDSPYHPIGLSPGKDGVGSGVCIQHRSTAVNLITLYSATRAEREAARAGNQARINRLVSSAANPGQREGESELTPAIQELCRQSDAAILVVDSTNMTEDTVKLDQLMLQSVLHANTLQTTPLLVLSCRPATETVGGVSVIDVSNKLRLCDLHQPWQVRGLVLSQYQSLQTGMDWLLGAAHL